MAGVAARRSPRKAVVFRRVVQRGVGIAWPRSWSVSTLHTAHRMKVIRKG